MATIHADVFDNGLTTYEEANLVVLLSQEPADYNAAFATHRLASVGVTASDYTVGAGDTVGGRKVTQGELTVDGESDGLATHFAVLDTVGSRLLHAQTMTTVGITTGQPQQVSAVRLLEIVQPA